MAYSRGGYSGYHGRRTLNDLLKLIAAVLAVLVVLMLGLLFFGQDYLVYTDDGLRLDLPFLQEEEPELPEPGDISVVIQPQGEDKPEPEPEEPAMTALELPVEAVLDGTALDKLEEAGANALILEMKDQEGKLAWVSEQMGSYMEHVNGGDQEVNEALKRWNQGEVYTVARVCCFRDNTVPYYRRAMAIRSGQGNWRDELGLRWMDPASEETQDYLAALCGELAQLGFDEIVLEQCSFPIRGNRQTISEGVDPARYPQVMDQFLAQVERTLAAGETKLSIRIEREHLTGENGGLTSTTLNKSGRLWMERDGESPNLTVALVAAGITDAQERLVELTSDLSGEEEGPRAVLTGT